MPATKKQVKYPETTKSSRVLKTSSLKNILGLIIALFAILLYVQSVSFKFAADDETILTSNSITKEGIRGIPTILTKDYWYGYQDSIRVPEYRPTSLVMFATEWQVYKDNPHYYHAVNILLYAIRRLVNFYTSMPFVQQSEPAISIYLRFAIYRTSYSHGGG